jgi:predicted RNA-binding protein
MAYYLDIFSPETYEAFIKSPQDITGFRARQASLAERIRPGDKFICYMTKLSRWFGVLEVLSDCYHDETPRFYPEGDPFVIRFKIRPICLLEKEKAIPIREDKIWNILSFTQGHIKAGSQWTGRLRASLTKIEDEDGKFLEEMILSQSGEGVTYQVDEREYHKYLTQRVRGADKVITVSVPEDQENKEKSGRRNESEVRQSIKIQAMLAEIGEKMGFKIWIPKNDRGKVIQEWQPEQGALLESLPLNYDQATIKTIEQIDVLWLRRRSIVRAFEVEHTTSIYSGILRMADLLALQPNMDIKLHLVAPDERRDKVFEEIQRPVFSLLERGPLSEYCTFISYDSLCELAQEKHLAHLSDKVLEDYEEVVE